MHIVIHRDCGKVFLQVFLTMVDCSALDTRQRMRRQDSSALLARDRHLGCRIELVSLKSRISSTRRRTSEVLHIIDAAGWPIWPLIVASVIALGIIVERGWSLQSGKVVPRALLPEVAQEVKQKGVSQDLLNRLSQG